MLEVWREHAIVKSYPAGTEHHPENDPVPGRLRVGGVFMAGVWSGGDLYEPGQWTGCGEDLLSCAYTVPDPNCPICNPQVPPGEVWMIHRRPPGHPLATGSGRTPS